MKIDKKNLSKYVLDDLNEINCIYVNPVTYELCLESDNGCVRFWADEEKEVAIIKMKHCKTPQIEKQWCSEVITHTLIADIYVYNLAVEIYFEDDYCIMFRLDPICFNDDGEPYSLHDLKLITTYSKIEA